MSGKLTQAQVDAMLGGGSSEPADSTGETTHLQNANEPAPSQSGESSTTPNYKTVLIVDDSSFMRNLIKEAIKDYDLTVVGEAENGIEGVEKYKELKPDLVFMDHMMEEMMGLDALEQIMKYDKNAAVVMLTTVSGQEFVVADAKSRGAKAVLNKPLSSRAVDELLGKKKY